MIAQGFVNTVGWCLVGASAIIVVSSTLGVVYVALQPGEGTPEAVVQLQDTYYVVQRSVWPLLLCLILGVVIGIVGFMHTDMLVKRMIRNDVESVGDA